MKTFVIRTLNMIVIAAVLLLYNKYALVRAEKVEAYEAEQTAYEKAVAEIEKASEIAKANAEEKKEQEETALTEEEGVYPDGVYQGSGQGFGGEIQVEVTVSEHEITKIEILSAEKEDSAYLKEAVSVVDEIIDQQSVEVDTVSGATFSSGGIREAVENALKDAA